MHFPELTLARTLSHPWLRRDRRGWFSAAGVVKGGLRHSRAPPRCLAVSAALVLLAGCNTGGHPAAQSSAAAGASSPFADAASPARPTAPKTQVASEARTAPARLYPGTGVFVRASIAGTQGKPDSQDGDITLNFVDADVREVVHAVLGDLLHLNYALDPKVQATVTIQTSHPLRRDDVLPALQQALRLSGVALVPNQDIYRVVPIEEAVHGAAVTGQPPGQQGAPGPVFSTQIVPLRYVAAAEIQRMLQPYIPKGARVEADTTRNLLLVSGTGQDLGAVTELINTFDVDWLSGMSLGIVPLQTGTAKGVASELETIFSSGSGGSLAGVVRFVPIERTNSILIISSQRAYLERARSWIARLDQEDENTARIYEYHVQNSRAVDLAKVLSQLLSSGQVATVDTTQTAPGTTPTQIGSPLSSSGLGTSSNSLSSTPTSSPSATPLSAQATPQTQGLNPAPTAPAAPAVAPPDFSGTGGTPSSGSAGDLGLPQARVVADEKNNALVIFAKPRDYRMIEDAIKNLDVVPLQVLIEATIAEVTLTNDLQYGVEWFFKTGANKFGFTNDPLGAVTAISPGFNYVLSTANAKVVLSALSSLTDVNVISSPQLLVLDHHVATLQVGDQVPVPVQQSQSTLVAGSPLINTIEFVDTGVILRVSPRVNTNGLIALDITQQVSQAQKTTTSGIDAPTISQRRVDSTITVQDGETIALGGLITDNRTKNKSGIPILSTIPVVGSLFGTTDNSSKRTELLILLSPRVVHDSYEARSLTQELRDRLRGLEGLGARVR